jgi:hypothetical protein
VNPSYRFSTDDPTIGDFVLPSGPGSRYPMLDASGHPIPSDQSGLWCAYNTGTTHVNITTGLVKASLPVTVLAGNIGRPCGTVFRQGVGRVVLVPSSVTRTTTQSPPGAGAPISPPLGAAAGTVAAALPSLVPPPPPPPVTPKAPTPHRSPPLVPSVGPGLLPAPGKHVPPPPPPPNQPAVAVPPIPPVAQPIPPGGAASAQAAARRKEKARKHASQSAYVTRPAGMSAEDFFYPAVGVATVLTLLLVAGGMRPGPRRRAAEAFAHLPGYR